MCAYVSAGVAVCQHVCVCVYIYIYLIQRVCIIHSVYVREPFNSLLPLPLLILLEGGTVALNGDANLNLVASREGRRIKKTNSVNKPVSRCFISVAGTAMSYPRPGQRSCGTLQRFHDPALSPRSQHSDTQPLPEGLPDAAARSDCVTVCWRSFTALYCCC